MNTKIILLDDNKTEVAVKKLALGRYPEILAGITELPAILQSFDKLDPDSLFASLPTIIAKAFPDILHILAVATDLPKQAIEEELGLSEAVKIVVALLEVNNYREIYDLIKKMIAQPTVKAIK